MSSVHHLREFICGRLTAAAAEIFSEFEKTILRYEEEMERQRRLLDLCWKPELKLHRVDLRQEWVQKMDLILTNQQPSVDQEEPGPLALKIVQIRGGWTRPELPKIEDQTEPELPQIKEEQQDPEPAEFQYSEDPEPAEFKYLEDPEPAELEEEQELCTNQEENQLHQNQGTDPILNEESESEPDVEQLTSQSSAGPEDQDQDSEPVKKTNSGERGSGSLAGVGMSRTTGRKRCVLCGRGYKRWRQLSSHYTVHRRQGQVVGRISVKTLRDKSQCMAGTSTAAGKVLSGHIKNHTKRRRKTGQKAANRNHTCRTCGKLYTRRYSLLIHMRVHTGEKPYSCQICGEKFAYSQILKYHMKKHDNRKNNCDKKNQPTCSVCGKKLTSKGSLKLHMRIHTGEKPFSCSVCEKKLISKGSLKLHMRIHTGEKPYSCQMCEKAFMYKSQLNSHMKVHKELSS